MNESWRQEKTATSLSIVSHKPWQDDETEMGKKWQISIYADKIEHSTIARAFPLYSKQSRADALTHTLCVRKIGIFRSFLLCLSCFPFGFIVTYAVAIAKARIQLKIIGFSISHSSHFYCVCVRMCSTIHSIPLSSSFRSSQSPAALFHLWGNLYTTKQFYVMRACVK